MAWREGWHFPELVETYRGMRLMMTYARRPGERDYDRVFITPGWPGIWFTLQGLRDYVDWRMTR